MIVDATITVGNMIEIAVLAVATAGAVLAIKSSVGNMKNDLIDLKEEMKKVGEVLIKMAVTDQRLTNAEQDIRDLKHGRGFITNRSDGGMNGEWP